MKAVLMSLLVMQSLSAQAGGDKVGGGGDVVICPNAPVKYRLLDAVEAARAENGSLTMNLGGPGVSIEKKIEMMHARLAAKDGARADEYRAEVLKMYADLKASEAGREGPHHEAVLWSRLPDIDDENMNFIVPTGCTKDQLVKQDERSDETDWTYRVVREHWEKMNSDQKVATLYHEAIYKEFRRLGHIHSRLARRMNAYLFSGEIEKMSICRYTKFIKSAKSTTIDVFGRFKAHVNHVKCDESGALTSIDFAPARLTDSIVSNLSDLRFKNDQLISGMAGEAFYLVKSGSGLTITTQKEGATAWNNGFTGLEFLTDGSLLMKAYDKKSQSMMGSLLVASNGQVLRRYEAGFLYGQLSAPEKEAMTEVVSCVQQGLAGNKASSALAASLFGTVGEAVRSAQKRDEAGVRSALKACKDAVATAPVGKVTKADRIRIAAEHRSKDTEVDFPVRQLIVRMVSPVNPLHCEMKGLAIGAAMLLGLDVGYKQAVCLMNNAKVFRYAGPRLQITQGFGVHGSFDHYDTATTSTDLEGGGRVITEGLLRGREGVGVIRTEGQLGGVEIDGKSPVSGVGVYSGGSAFGSFTYRIGNRNVSDFSKHLMDLLSRETSEVPVN